VTRYVRTAACSWRSPPARSPTDPLALARDGRYGDLASIGVAALPPLLEAYPTADRETRSAILLALGALDVKSPAATTVLRADVDGRTPRSRTSIATRSRSSIRRCGAPISSRR
jgi:hypothetical protein